ncbi:hypothetical protein PTR25_08175 [Serratia nevei]|uniref:hypothetical protein n=1 Tax=Serratia TaxID=613 RepID=UPI00313BAC4D
MTKLIKPSTKALHSFLNDKNGLVVHFSGCPKGIGPGKKLFPGDLKDILSGKITGALSCSVVIPGDFYSPEPDKGHATGTIGVILDVDGSNLSAVSHCDAGSYVDDDGNRHVPEKNITINDLEDSLSSRITYNEWIIKPCDIKGIFIFHPDHIFIRAMAKISGCEELIEDDVLIHLHEVCNHFPACEIFTFTKNKISKLDRNTNNFIVQTEKFYG